MEDTSPSLNVKVLLYRSWREDPIEIRRLSWEPSGAAGKFRGFAEKVASVFPALSPDELKLHWTDEDGDRILISSDEELTLALQSADGQLFRIHALHVPREESARDQPQPSAPQPGRGQQQSGHGHNPHHGRGAYHFNVVCDGCEGHIFGTRYKCLTCVDFDLCSSCEGKGLHSQHNMVAMENPQPRCGWGPWGRGRGRRCGQWRGGHPYFHGHQFFGPWGNPWGSTWGGSCPSGSPQWGEGCSSGASTEQRREAVQQVLQHITPFLHQMGIEVDARVVDDPPTQPPPAEGTGSEPAPPTTTQETMDETQQPADDAVAEVTQQLQSMGFDDEGGWLTELVRARGGDIDKVLETLHWEK